MQSMAYYGMDKALIRDTSWGIHETYRDTVTMRSRWSSCQLKDCPGTWTSCTGCRAHPDHLQALKPQRQFLATVFHYHLHAYQLASVQPSACKMEWVSFTVIITQAHAFVYLEGEGCKRENIGHVGQQIVKLVRKWKTRWLVRICDSWKSLLHWNSQMWQAVVW